MSRLREVLPWPLVGAERAQRLYLLSLALLGLGTVLAVLALRWPRLSLVAAVGATAGATSWLLTNAAGEGPTLLVVRPGNGVTAADLAALPAVVLVGLLCLRSLRRSG